MCDDGEQPADAYLDARGLICPLPVLRARKRLAGLDPGTVLRVDATDASARADFEAFCAATGHRLLSLETDGALIRVRIEARARPAD